MRLIHNFNERITLHFISTHSSRVSAGNVVGFSDYSNAVSGAPFDSAPEPPSNARVLRVGKTEAELAWETPSEDKGVIRYYQMDYRRDGDRDFVTVRINDPKTPTQTFTIRNLFRYKLKAWRVNLRKRTTFYVVFPFVSMSFKEARKIVLVTLRDIINRLQLVSSNFSKNTISLILESNASCPLIQLGQSEITDFKTPVLKSVVLVL